MKYQASITAAAPIPTPTPTPPTAASSATDKDTIPKTLPAGVYNQLVKDYNDVKVSGEKREFPGKVLLGADKVLARMHHEHTVSKHYTAVTLGEIMSQRVFTALGTVNSARKKDDLDKRLVVDSKHQLVSKEPSDWDVKRPQHDPGRHRRGTLGLDPHQVRHGESSQQILRLVDYPGSPKLRQASPDQDLVGVLCVGHRHENETDGDL